MVGTVAALLIFLAVYNTHATNNPENTWHEGSLVLSDKQVLKGEIVVQGAFDLVLFREEGENFTIFPAHKLKSVSLYDEHADINRKYVTRKVHSKGLFVYRMYEVVVHGEVEVLRRQIVKNHHGGLSDKYDFDYFVVAQHGIVALNRFREDVYPWMMTVCPAELKAYRKQNHLNPNLRADAIQMILFFNKAYPKLLASR